MGACGAGSCGDTANTMRVSKSFSINRCVRQTKPISAPTKRSSQSRRRSHSLMPGTHMAEAAGTHECREGQVPKRASGSGYLCRARGLISTECRASLRSGGGNRRAQAESTRRQGGAERLIEPKCQRTNVEMYTNNVNPSIKWTDVISWNRPVGDRLVRYRSSNRVK